LCDDNDDSVMVKWGRECGVARNRNPLFKPAYLKLILN